MGPSSNHHLGHAGLIVTTVLVFICVLVTNGLAAAGSSGLFLNKTGDIIDKYYLEITPAGWTFSVWVIIYLWQLAFLAYALSTVFRRVPSSGASQGGSTDGGGGYLYVALGTMPIKLYLVYNLSSGLSIAWVFLWDRELMLGSFPVLLLLSAALYLCLAFSSHALTGQLHTLKERDLMREAWLIRFVVHNGLAFYATWVFVAAMLNFAIVLIYFAEIAHQTACSVCLGVLSAVVLVYVILDTFLLDRFIRYTFSHYLVIIVALFGSNDQNYVVGNANSTFSAVLLAAACAVAIMKVIMMLWRHCNRPLIKTRGESVGATGRGRLLPTSAAESEV